MKKQEVKEVVLAVVRLLIHEIKKGERERVLNEANSILAKYGKRIKYIPSVMEVMLDGEWGKGDSRRKQ